jgi:hypothetical protein
MAKQPKGAAIRIVGSRVEISGILAAFATKGFTWQSNEHFYPRRDQQGFFSYYLENFKPGQNKATEAEYKSLAEE